MPYLSPEKRSSGAYAASVEVWDDVDWSVPTDAATLRHRRLPPADQSRYGGSRVDPSPRNIDGTLRRPKP